MNDLVLRRYGSIKSFGNKTLEQNMELVKEAISDIEPLQKMFDRQHTQFQTKFFIIGKQDTKHRAVRQICVEIKRKEEALIHNLHKLSLQEIDIEQMEENLIHEQNKFSRRKMKLEIQHNKITREQALQPIQAVLRDILLLHSFYQSIYEKMTEDEIEYSETEYWILRLCNSGIRDVRLNNRIGLGVQLALQNIGVNPLYIQTRMQVFIQKEIKNLKPDLTDWHKELSQIVKDVIDVPSQYAKIKNINMGIFHDGIYQEEYDT